MLVRNDNSLNKLILLFVFDKMEVPLSEYTVIDICCSSNNWIAYMDCQPLLSKLIDDGLLFYPNQTTINTEKMFAITPDGRVCLANFFNKIPASIRENISLFIKNNRLKYKRKQECVADYYMNKDGTYTVFLKIIEPSQPILELKIVVPNRQAAKDIYKKWDEKATGIYTLLYENLVD